MSRYWAVRFLAFGLIATTTSLAVEIASRCYWSFAKGVPFFQMGDMWKAFHREVATSGVLEADFSSPESTFDVLLLGGSVLTPEFGDIAKTLEERLTAYSDQRVRVFNLAEAARTSRDSLIKYQQVGDRPFDLVLVYNSINDVRMNNCPPNTFRDDYSHCAWYRQFYMLKEHPELSLTVIPYTLHYLAVEGMLKFGLGGFIPRHKPDDRYVYCDSSPTQRSLRFNLETILTLTGERRQKVILLSFATYVPADYALERFETKQLNYGQHLSPIEIWGRPDQVKACLLEHNRVIQELAGSYPHVIYVDQAATIPGGKDYFDDICHFTDAGCRCFVDNVMTALENHHLHR